MDNKYLIFLIGTALIVPMGVFIASKSEYALNFVFVALVFGTTQPDSLFGLPTDINFFSKEWYRGTTRGVEVSYLDLLAIILLFASKSWRRRERLPKIDPPSYGYLKAYFIWAAFTVMFISDPKIFGVFEVTKILRGIIIFLAVFSFVRGEKQLHLFIYAIIFVACYEGSVALYHRYVVGVHRVQGTLGHPNSLSMYCLMIFPITFSLWFATDLTRKVRKFALAASGLMAVSIVLTISRTGFAALGLLTILTVYLNARGNWNARTIGFLLLIVATGLGVTYKAWDSLSARYATFDVKNEYMTAEGDRGSYFRKGWPAFEDNPVAGVGLNNWSYWISNKYAAKAGYPSEPYKSTDWSPFSPSSDAPAHNLLLLTLVEIGFVGLLSLLALFARWLHISAKGILGQQTTFQDRLRIGLLLSLVGILMQSATEWELRQTPLFFIAHVIVAVSAFIYYQRYSGKK